MILKNSSDTAVSNIIEYLSSKKKDARLIENKLIDGSMHIQTIGDARDYYLMDIFANHEQVELIDLGISIGEVFTLEIDESTSLEGFLKVENWERLTKRTTDKAETYYKTTNARFDIVGGGD